jgi:hypothetical protein
VDPWLTELAKVGPVAIVLGGAVAALWRKLQQKDAAIAALTEQQRQDMKEHSKQLLESARYMESIIRKLYQREGRSISPFPSSSP